MEIESTEINETTIKEVKSMDLDEFNMWASEFIVKKRSKSQTQVLESLADSREKFAKFDPLLEFYFGFYQSWAFSENQIKGNHFDREFDLPLPED